MNQAPSATTSHSLHLLTSETATLGMRQPSSHWLRPLPSTARLWAHAIHRSNCYGPLGSDGVDHWPPPLTIIGHVVFEIARWRQAESRRPVPIQLGQLQFQSRSAQLHQLCPLASRGLRFATDIQVRCVCLMGGVERTVSHSREATPWPILLS